MAKKVHEVISSLEAHGWQQMRQRGSNRQFKHRDSIYVITVTGKRRDTISIGQLQAIRRKSGIKELR